MYKYFSALIILIIVCWLFWFNLNLWLNNPFSFSETSFRINYSLFAVLALFIVSVSLISLSFLLFDDKWCKLSFIGLIFLTFIFVFGYHKLYLASFALSFLFLDLAIRRFKTEVEQHVKINIWHIMQRASHGIITAFLIFVSFAYFLTPLVQEAAYKKELPPTAQKIVSFVVENFANSQNLDPSLLKTVEKQTIGQLNTFLKPYYKFLPPILAFGLFLILKGFSFLFVWLSSLMSVLMFWIFKKSGIVSLEIIKRDAEVIKF